MPLAEDAVATVAAILDAVGPAGAARGIRWVLADRLHLTLRFLGAADADAVPPLAEAITDAAAGSARFRVSLEGAGAFPSLQRPRVLWLGIREGAAELTALAAALERRLADAGWAPTGRPFKPHLTVARADAAPYDVGSDAARALIAAADGRTTAFDVDRLVLYQSHLGRGPARYQPLAEARLLSG